MGNTKDENVSYNAAQEMIWPTDNAATAAQSQGAGRQELKVLGDYPEQPTLVFVTPQTSDKARSC